MEIIERTALDQSEIDQLMRLWNAEYPEQICHGKPEELMAYLEKIRPDKQYLAVQKGKICAWMVLFQREGATWFAMIVANDFQGRGLGSGLIKLVKRGHRELLGWVIDKEHFTKADGTPYTSPMAFYLKNGFETCPDKRLESDKISAVQVRWRKSEA